MARLVVSEGGGGERPVTAEPVLGIEGIASVQRQGERR